MATRYTKFTLRKKRIERLQREIGWLKNVEDATGADAKRLKAKLEHELFWLNADITHAYEIVNCMKTEKEKMVTELRYFDGMEWTEIAKETGLSLQRLYQINMQIRIHFNDKGRDDLLFSEDPGR